MSKQIVITGMHRSGTSLVTSLIQKAGLNIGDQLQGSSRGNIRGHFEDSDFYNFHEEMLKRRGQSFLIQAPIFLNDITEEEQKRAHTIIEQRQGRKIWGWKDPRTCLFLNFWYELLPNARYLFLYRHPLEVILSLLRRGTDLEVLLDPSVGLRTWHVYNQNLLNFSHNHPELCLLCHISGVTSNLEAFINMLAERFELPLEPREALSLYQPDELKQGFVSVEADKLLDQLYPEVITLYRQLEVRATLPSSERSILSEFQTQSLFDLIQTASNLTRREGPLKEKQDELLFSLLQILDPDAVKIATIALGESLTNHRNHVQQLEVFIQQQESRIQELTNHIQQLEVAIQQQQTTIQQQQTHIQQQQTAIQQQQTHIQQLETTLSGIYQTRLWQLAKKFWGLKKFFAV